MAFVIAPEPPLIAWIAELDAQMARSPGFFEARPVIIDLAAVTADDPAAATLLAELERRGISVIDVENAGAVPGADPWRRPLVGGRNTGEVEIPAGDDADALRAKPAEDSFMLVDGHVRSGQSVTFTRGDLTIAGSVSSGAEVVAGGSIHIYGTLRGRALAGALGAANVGIFCRRFEAELVSIDGFYRTADSIDPALRGRAVAIRLDGDSLVIAPLG
jgi:septum site-determining protein MinC